MILNKSNLKIVDIVREDKGIPMLNNLHVDKDGITSAIGNKIMLVMSAVKDKASESIAKMNTWVRDSFTITVPADSVKEVLKNIPKDTKFGGLLEHVELDAEGQFKLSDGRRQRQIKCIPWGREFPSWRDVWEKQKTEYAVRAVYNRKRLLLLMQTMDKVCEDTSGYSPIWIEISKDGTMILRSVNMKTGQKALGIAGSYAGKEGEWISDEEFEIVKKPLPKRREK